MECLRGYSVFLLILAIWPTTDSSKMTITAAPSPFSPMLSQLLSLRCAVGDSPTSPTPASNSVIGKRQTEKSTDGNVFPISTEIAFVTSLTILRNNEDVASVSEHIPAKALTDTTNMAVAGNIGGSSGERAFLDLTWNQPTITQRGNYSCLVAGITTIGHPIIYTGSVVVESSTPTIDDIVSHVYSQGLEINQMKRNQSRLLELVHDQEVKIDQMNNEQQLYKHNQSLLILEMDQMKSDMMKVKQNQTALYHEVDLVKESMHVENGVIFCSNLLFGGDTANKTVTFKKPYTMNPIVHIALLDAAINKDLNAYFTIRLIHTDRYGFTVQFKVTGGDTFWIGNPEVSWISLSDF